MAFNSLPLELNEQIAIFLDTDREVCDFRLICHATNAAVTTHRSGVWRGRYAQRYDLPDKIGGQEISMRYKIRSKLLRKSARFSVGQEPREISCMRILRDLIIESYADLPIGRKAIHLSNNLEVVERFVRRSRMLRKVVNCLEEKHEKSNINPLLQTLQLVLAHLELSIPSSKANPMLGFGYSQYAVYSYPDAFPMFNVTGTWQISTNLLLHMVNFFKQHLTLEGESVLYDLFSQLKEHEKPKFWNSRLVEGAVHQLGKHWKGTYAYLHEIEEIDLIRHCEPGNCISIDSIDHHDGFQTLELDFEPQANRTRWPKVFESHLHALPPDDLCNMIDCVPENKGLQAPRTIPKRGVHYQQFSGSGTDAEVFHCSGILHPLPPQQQIPGWHRISMMKYFDPLAHPSTMPPQTGSADFDMYHVDDDAEINAGCWAYEGVVLPGGMIMLGRWWSPMDDTGLKKCTGPFIFWNVDEN